ncbi:NUDIX domain-containing protein [Candidatus Nomurabacteria bacterium]|nr:NUDIX domain-containing protein [Candidatus Nomurabacteria bacterium]
MMKNICTIHENDVYPNKKTAPVKYTDRLTVKAIVLDFEGKIGLVGNKQNVFFQLPGGGISTSETMNEGVKRECLEEIGCSIKIVSEIGYIDDYRPRDKKHCISYCYIVEVIGEKGKPNYTKNEAEIGMYTKWVSTKDALELFEKQKQDLEKGIITFYNTGFNILRDYLFLKQAVSEKKIK